MSNPALTEAVFYILLSLMQPLHGYGIMQNVEALSNGRVKLAARQPQQKGISYNRTWQAGRYRRNCTA